MPEQSLPGFDHLAPLETFDKTVFLDPDRNVQKVCDLVLTLALVYNDFKDIYLAIYHWQRARPAGDVRETPTWGQYFGMDGHLFRLQAATLHALAELLDNYGRVIQHPLFQRTVAALNDDSRADWQQLLTPNSELRRYIRNIRHAIGSHYIVQDQRGDLGVLADGYRQWANQPVQPGQIGRRALMSRGATILSARYYFADAAALKITLSLRPADYEQVWNAHAQQVSIVLSGIVQNFIEIRGGQIVRA